MLLYLASLSTQPSTGRRGLPLPREALGLRHLISLTVSVRQHRPLRTVASTWTEQGSNVAKIR